MNAIPTQSIPRLRLRALTLADLDAMGAMRRSAMSFLGGQALVLLHPAPAGPSSGA